MLQVILSKIEYGVPLTQDDLTLLYAWGLEVITAYETITEDTEVEYEEAA